MPITAWQVETDPVILRRVGKTGEELAELSKVCNRIVIQGYDGIDPETGISNRESFWKEMADVQAQIACNMAYLSFPQELFESRMHQKIEQMNEWERLLINENKCQS